MTDPVIFRKFQYTGLKENSNKTWIVKWWADNTMETSWGRVGAEMQSNQKRMSRGGVEALICEKTAKGYREIDLHIPTVIPNMTVPSLDPKTSHLVSMIYAEAGQHIKSYLAIGVDALSKQQIVEGRKLLKEIKDDNLYGPVISKRATGKTNWDATLYKVEQFYATIPTILPRKIEPDEVAKDLIYNLADHFDRLDQLEAALSTFSVQNASGGQQLAALDGTEIEWLDPSANAYRKLYDYVQRTSGGRRRIHDIFRVHILAERAAYETETKGKSNVTALFHGTRHENIRHILRSGLIIPHSAANGSRFGRGIYFADASQRSLGYVARKTAPWNMLFVCDVALGRAKKLDGDDSSLRAAPTGFDSVWGIKSYSGLDEFIIYKPSQQTLRAIITIE